MSKTAPAPSLVVPMLIKPQLLMGLGPHCWRIGSLSSQAAHVCQMKLTGNEVKVLSALGCVVSMGLLVAEVGGLLRKDGSTLAPHMLM